MRLIQRVMLSAGIAGIAVAFLVANGIFASEDGLALFGVVGLMMMLMRPERIFRHQIQPESACGDGDPSSDSRTGQR